MILALGQYIEAYQNQYIPLENESKQLKLEIAGYDLQLAQSERSEEYEHILKLITDRRIIDGKKLKLEEPEAKLLLKVIFKEIFLEGGKLKTFELYEPFQSNYAGDTIICQTQENKRFTKLSPSKHSVDRTFLYGTTLLKLINAISG